MFPELDQGVEQSLEHLRVQLAMPMRGYGLALLVLLMVPTEQALSLELEYLLEPLALIGRGCFPPQH